MMLVRTLMAVVLFFTPFAVCAQNLTIRSGEHDNFTRLVVPIAAGQEWKIMHEDRTVTFSMPNFDGTFDTSEIFQFVPKDRLLEVNTERGSLLITLGCDCKVAPFMVRDRFVVVDIAAQGVALNAQALEQFVQPGRSAELEVVENAVEPTLLKVALPTVLEKDQQEPSQFLQPAELPIRARESLSDVQNAALLEMQKRLVRQLGSAATRGVLNPIPSRDLPRLSTSQTADTDGRNIIETPQAGRPDPQVINSMRVTSSNNLPLLLLGPQEAHSVLGMTCLSNDTFNMMTWADERPFFEQIAEARRHLFGELDKLNTSWAIKLAKIYLYFGFGAEAMQILSLEPVQVISSPLLLDIAYIMESGIASDQSNLRKFLDCDTDVSLWAILARKELNIARTIDPSAALFALKKLPVHLRKFIAPALSERLLSHGDSIAASAALRSLERLPSSLPSAAQLALANIVIEDGDFSSGAIKLKAIIDKNAEQSPDALVRLVETQLKANRPIDPETVRLVAAYAKELKASKAGPALRRAHILALVKSGQFDKAFSAMRELSADAQDSEITDLKLQVLDEVIIHAEDITFLDYIFSQSVAERSVIPNRSKLDLAERLLNLGFNVLAGSMLESVPARPRNIRRQTLLAQTALLSESPERALTALIDISGEESDVLRARANSMTGQYSEASAWYRQSNELQAAVDAAWLAGEKDSSALTEDPVFGPVLALSPSSVDVPLVSDGMLERTDAALKESELARQTLLTFLEVPKVSLSEFNTME